MNLLSELKKQKLIECPSFVVDNLILLSVAGSHSYGTATPESDKDIYGICIPPKEYVYFDGIVGFESPNIFNEWQQQGIVYNNEEFDIKVYSIVRVFKLALEGNPNILDFLSVTNDCVLYQHRFGELIRNNWSYFLSKQAIPRYFGFAISHLKSMQNRNTSGIFPEKRKHLYEKYGYDTKDFAHIYRGLKSLEDILLYGYYRPNAYSKEVLEVRNGKYTYNEALDWVDKARNRVANLEITSKLRNHPKIDIITTLLEGILYLWFNGSDYINLQINHDVEKPKITEYEEYIRKQVNVI